MHLPRVNQEISALNRALSSSEISNYLKCMELEEKKEKDGKAENKEGKAPIKTSTEAWMYHIKDQVTNPLSEKR